jgi:tRNA pseudouridine13 synthase
LRDLSADDASRVGERLDRVARYGLPNFFDEQRFGSYCPEPDAPDRFIGKTILRRDTAGAVRAYLAHPFIGDPQRVRKFKAVARQHWGEWAYLLGKAPRPSNYRSVLTYLKDHPEGFRKALNLIPRRLLSLFLVAYQSYLWNEIAGGYLAHKLPAESPTLTLTILDLTLPTYHTLSSSKLEALSAMRVPLPGHRAVYANPILAEIVQEVLASEDLELNDLKARVLRRAYLPKGQRSLLLFPADAVSHAIEDDDEYVGRQATRVSFTLPRGAFATLVIKRLSLPDDDQSTDQSGPSLQAPVSAPAEDATRSGDLLEI